MDDGSASASPSSASPNQHHHRDAIKSSVHNSASSRRREQAIAIGKERREALMRAKRVCRAPLSGNDEAAVEDGDMVIDEEKSDLEARTARAVEDLKSALSSQGKGAQKKKMEVLRALRRLLSQSEVPPVEAAIKAGAVPLLVQYLSFGSSDEQLLEAAWCLTNIAAGEPEDTRSLVPALPLLIAHLGEKSSTLVAEQCAWAIGNVAGEGSELRNKLVAQGALLPLARLMLSNKGSTARTAAWALSNLIKGPDPKAANELISVDGVLNSIIRNLEKADEELATEVAWVVVYLSALSEKAVSLIVKSSVPQLLIGRLLASENLQLLIPVLRGLGNLVAGDGYTVDSILLVGNSITDQALSSLIKCLKSDNRVLKKEASWAMSNIATGSFEHKKLIFGSEAPPLLIHLLTTAQFDIRREAAYTLGNLCVVPAGNASPPNIIVDHLVAIVNGGALPGFINLEASWAMSNIATGSFEHKKLIFGSEAPPLLIHLLTTAQFDIRREAAYTLGNLCVVPAGNASPPNIIVDHLVAIVNGGALPGFINLVRSADIESARIGLQFLELVMRGYPNGQGPKLVETEDGIEAMERFQFHENEVMRNMANGLVDKYFGEDYGLE